MKDKELSIERFIKLITKEELDKKAAKAWYHCVIKHAPVGVAKTINMVDDKGKPHGVALIHREGETTNSYLVPLTRDLSDDEIDKIVHGFSEKNPDLDFQIETNETKLSASDYSGLSLDASKHMALCTALEKQKHENWVRERNKSGWRYGTEFDQDEKTHPLILPWDQLPDRYKQPDMEWPQKLVHMLNSEGYAIIPKEELNDLLRIMRSVK